MAIKNNAIPLKNCWKSNYLLSFLLGFCSLMVVLIPIMIFEKGYFLYYGDYNSQQIPFYSLANDAVRSGSFGWNWYTDLGSNFIGSYSFYLLGSPFFWLTTILPKNAIIYAMPFIISIKHGVASLTAYAYIQRFVKNKKAAVIGGLLYSFSGFQLFNIFFNHFHDVTAFFPLMLIAMEEAINNNRKGVFALSVALMSAINYFFFTGQAVFLVLYFVVRCCSNDFKATPKKFICLALEAVIGVMLSCFILLPSALAILENNRVSSHLYGNDLIAYSDQTRIWRIIQSFFMISDVPARPNLFSSNNAKWSSIGGYLPLFSMVGVLTFMKQKEKHWAKRLVLICIICAFIPILNSAFYAFNGSYYARWYYMPILIMAMMTAYVLDNHKMNAKYGISICGIFLTAFFIISALPVKKNDKVIWGRFPKYPEHFYITFIICVVSLIITALLFNMRSKGKNILKHACVLTVAASIACTMSTIYFGAYTPQRAIEYIDKAIDKENDIEISVSPDNFFRVDISKDRDNYPMLWQLPCMRTFHSIVPASIMDFYSSIGITRDVASRVDTSYYTLRGLFSVEYYFQEIDKEDIVSDEMPVCDLKGFSYYDKQNGFNVFKNDYAIPIGFTFDNYISESDWNNYTEENRSKILIDAIVLNDEQIEKYGNLLSPFEKNNDVFTEEYYLKACTKRASSACHTFNYDSKGFTAQISSQKDNLVFFSVPWDSGWSAKVNGENVDIEKVDTGFMAVPVSEGENTITFTYQTPGLKTGFMISIAGLTGFIIYMFVCYKFFNKKSEKVDVYCIDYDNDNEN